MIRAQVLVFAYLFTLHSNIAEKSKLYIYFILKVVQFKHFLVYIFAQYFKDFVYFLLEYFMT